MCWGHASGHGPVDWHLSGLHRMFQGSGSTEVGADALHTGLQGPKQWRTTGDKCTSSRYYGAIPWPWAFPRGRTMSLARCVSRISGLKGEGVLPRGYGVSRRRGTPSYVACRLQGSKRHCGQVRVLYRYVSTRSFESSRRRAHFFARVGLGAKRSEAKRSEAWASALANQSPP